jgi:hypothetical protein
MRTLVLPYSTINKGPTIPDAAVFGTHPEENEDALAAMAVLAPDPHGLDRFA